MLQNRRSRRGQARRGDRKGERRDRISNCSGLATPQSSLRSNNRSNEGGTLGRCCQLARRQAVIGGYEETRGTLQTSSNNRTATASRARRLGCWRSSSCNVSKLRRVPTNDLHNFSTTNSLLRILGMEPLNDAIIDLGRDAPRH